MKTLHPYCLIFTLIGNCGDVLHDDLRGLGLPRTRLTADYDAGVPALLLHHLVGGVRYGEDVGRVFEEFPS